MNSDKCIPIKKHLIEFMKDYNSAFKFQASQGNLFVFCRHNEDKIYNYIFFQKEFAQGMIHMVITQVASCFNRNWHGIPWFTLGYDTDIACIITGKKVYDVKVGWHKCINTKEDFDLLLSEVKTDLDTYAIPYFKECHEKMVSERYLSIENENILKQFTILEEQKVEMIKAYLVDLNQAYSKYRKECRKRKQPETKDYMDIIPAPAIIQEWIKDLQILMNLPYLSDSMYRKVLKEITVLFRDYYNFYNLR